MTRFSSFISCSLAAQLVHLVFLAADQHQAEIIVQQVACFPAAEECPGTASRVPVYMTIFFPSGLISLFRRSNFSSSLAAGTVIHEIFDQRQLGGGGDSGGIIEQRAADDDDRRGIFQRNRFA